MRAAQQPPDIRFLEATPVAARRCDAGLVVNRQFLGPQRRQVRLWHVIAQPPEEPGDEDFRAGRHGRIAWRVELDEPDLPRGIAHREPRHHAIVLGRNHRPAARRRAGSGSRAFDEFINRDGYGPQPVREPRRVRHFIDRVEVLRADVRRLVARPREQVLERVVLQIDLPPLHGRRVLCVDDPRDRIVGIELPAVGARPCRHRHGDGTRQRGQPLTSPACVAPHQNAPPALTRRRAACSRLCATSTLNA